MSISTLEVSVRGGYAGYLAALLDQLGDGLLASPADANSDHQDSGEAEES